VNKKLADYQAADTLGKSSVELVVKVYDGAVGSLKQAAQAYRDENTEKGYELIEKAKRFVVHLYTTLDMDKGGEVSQNLSKLYVYVIEKLNIVQATKDLSLIENCIKVLSNVREGWGELAKQAKQPDHTAGQTDSEPKPARGVSFSI